MNPQFDQRDAEILQQRIREWQSVDGPRVGDFVHMPDGTLRRFTHDWGDDIQTTYRWRDSGAVESGSFYFGGAYVSFSGSLDRAIPKSALRDTGETRDGRAWFFHHNDMRAHNGVECLIPCRVYKYSE